MYFHQGNYLGGSDADDDLGFRFGSSSLNSLAAHGTKNSPDDHHNFLAVFQGQQVSYLVRTSNLSPGCCCANRTCSCIIGSKGIYRYNEAVTGCLKSPVAQGIRFELER